MRLSLLVVLFLLASGLAGCASSKGDASSSVTSGTTGPVPTVPTRPTNATDTGFTLTASKLNGTVPLNLTFQMGLTPAAMGRSANWTLAFGDGNTTKGAGLPANATHQYKVGGALTVRLNATLPNGLRLTKTLALNLTAGAAGVAFIPQTFHAAGTITLGTQGASCGVTGTVDVGSHDWVITGDPAAKIASIHVHADLGTTNVDSDVYLYDSTGKQLGSGTAFNAATGPTEDFTVKGPLPPGTYTIKVLGCVAVNGDYTIDAQAI